MFERKTLTVDEQADHKVIEVHQLIQRLNRVMKGLPGSFYLAFAPGETPKRVALLDAQYTPADRVPFSRNVVFDHFDADLENGGLILYESGVDGGRQATLEGALLLEALRRLPLTTWDEAMRQRSDDMATRQSSALRRAAE